MYCFFVVVFAGKKAIGDGNGVVPASRATPEGGVACNLRQHRYYHFVHFDARLPAFTHSIDMVVNNSLLITHRLSTL